jgi:uncharacterized membrane protein
VTARPLSSDSRPLLGAGLLLGIGLGGFVDGILLHQILQLHSMLSGIRPKLTIVDVEVNMFWDGLFHAFTWAMTVAGVVALWRAARVPRRLWSGRLFLGALILGWGLFNLVEGLLDHHLLGIHHVVESLGLSRFDWLFLAVGGLGFVVLGWALTLVDARAADRALTGSRRETV